MAGLIMHESQWHGIADEVRALKARREFNIKGEIKWRYFGAENDDADNSVAHLDQAARDQFRLHLFGIITSRNLHSEPTRRRAPSKAMALSDFQIEGGGLPSGGGLLTPLTQSPRPRQGRCNGFSLRNQGLRLRRMSEGGGFILKVGAVEDGHWLNSLILNMESAVGFVKCIIPAWMGATLILAAIIVISVAHGIFGTPVPW